MQKFNLEFKNVPRNAPQVPCSTSLQLNKLEKVSVVNKVLELNNSEVDPVQRTGRSLKANVFVLNNQGQPLMPCSYAKSKRMVKSGKAKVVKRAPFTIQLNFKCENKTQPITIGIDTGAKFIGFSAVSEKEELISGEVKLDNMMSKRLADRKMYRRKKRSRLWHRKPRFNNRVASKKKGWLPPSIQRKYDTHLSLIGKIKDMLPVSNVVIEVGNFDIQKLNDPMIEGVGYQQGAMYQYRNRIAYLLAREKGICQYCGKVHKKGDPWRLHHIWGKHKDKPEDWALLHKECHLKLHRLKQESVLRKKKSKSYKESTFMNIIKGRFQNDINCKLTFGYKTFTDRCDIGLKKSHINDAFIVAGGRTQERCFPFSVEQKRKNNRSLQKNRRGYAPSIRRQRYLIQINDLVKIDGQWVQTKGTHCKGARIMVNKKSINIKQVESVFHTGTLNWRIAFPPTTEVDGFPSYKVA